MTGPTEGHTHTPMFTLRPWSPGTPTRIHVHYSHGNTREMVLEGCENCGCTAPMWYIEYMNLTELNVRVIGNAVFSSPSAMRGPSL